MAVSWTLLFVLFDFGRAISPHKAALQIARLPFSQARYGKYPCRVQPFCRMDISGVHGFVSRKTGTAMPGANFSPVKYGATATA
jgi:hypothetical protein